ncbi:histidine partial : Signal transduction histidine kinase OS=Polaromonas sp. CF318 GN=PMI15_04884 PE=4 SV=1: Response_reg: GAF_3: HisKA: HATPase_c: Response_reg [Gemmataceae bacterium]|nr:histidine partial : Signal transduction histidine kinase OS=Polaromonas sp. CF318 GN=PMI15_04884 PE=4 SV=1: Response_reg: GAF_3: HisKA: HATPase_c: Response_reg [Gemmataceae bacterium]VTT97093.1 histidine partial : Signal transduction histidine kinase OS=Polaromonas sp. CF318 GN=PMI15_04884 PE=4 SV=1: Response_reg: GAF_3: HisKA: HATPase_c: Response_reg [Gemmataceae bacterium]
MTNDEPTSILVVDDLPEKLLVYRTVLEGLGQNIVTAGSGEEALKAVLKQDFAVILLDVQMPGIDGFETASLIRKRKRSAHTPIIFLTAFADEVRAAEGYAQGAVDYITTPIVPGILQAKVRVFADLYRMAQQVKRQAEERVALAEERMRREAVEEANHRLAFLARAGAVFGQSLDPEVAAQDVVRLPLPTLADVAALIPAGPNGRNLVGRVGEGGPVLDRDAGLGAIEPDLAAAAGEVLAAGDPAEQPDGAFVLPLRAGGRAFAALVLSRRPSGRTFAAADQALAQSFASRAAIALENARLYQEVQLADRQKNEFLSMLAHELRNPLAPIRNATVVIGRQGHDADRVRWAHGVIDRQLTHLIRLVDDLLDVSRITLGKIRLADEPVDLDAAVATAVEAARPLLDQFAHTLEVKLPAAPVRVTGDRARLTQVFTNLLNNAAKYTERGGRIWLTVGLEGGAAVVRVRDTGVGISAELLPTVFDLFTQASRSLDRSQGGLGVGLTLVRRLVEMHGGTVQAHSDGLGRGSEFAVRIPALVGGDAPPGPRDTSPGDAAAGGEHLRVVVVDDNVDGADTLADLLKLLGHQVRTAYDGPTGIAAVRAFDPDLVLLDIGLPGMDGYEIARRLGAAANGSGRPVLIAVSGYGQEADRGLSRAAGFAHHCVKPVEFDALRALLATVRVGRSGLAAQPQGDRPPGEPAPAPAAPPLATAAQPIP